MENIVSISGGKDSTAMLIEMLERGEKIHSAVFFDTGWEFPGMYPHIDRLEKYTGVKIWRLRSALPFEYWLSARPIIARKGPLKGQIHRIGNGWPSALRRWCTRIKVEAIKAFCRPLQNPVQCVGYAADETDRSFSDNQTAHRFPLQEYGIDEAEALRICYRHGFDWGGLYANFKRVSCFCCPLQNLESLRILQKNYPALWARMLEMDASIEVNRGFHHYATVHDLDIRFTKERLVKKAG